MGIVLHTKGNGSGGGVFTLWKYTATNYADLLTKVGMVEGDLAIVYNSQGVWLVNRKLKGIYLYQSGVWEYGNQELQNQIELSQYKVKIDSADSAGGYLEDKLVPNNDSYFFKTLGPNKTTALNIRAKIKPYVTNVDPTVNDDQTILDSFAPFQPIHQLGQLWLNETPPYNVFICKSLITGAAIWSKIPNIESLKTKSGIVLKVSFTGNPKTATVTFATAFADTNYSISLVCNTVSGKAYTPVVENILAGSFDINMTVNNINKLTDVRWIAVYNGEN